MAYQDVLVQSLFGAEIHDNGGMMPDTKPCISDIEEVKELETPDLHSGLTEKATADYRYLREHLPEEVEVIPIFVMDPLGVAVTLRGSDFYADLLSEAELSTRFLEIITDVMIDLICYFKRQAGQNQREYITNRGLYLPGFRLSSDFMIHLSPSMIREFMFPLFERLAEAFGPLLIHYCTEPQDASHVLPTLLECNVLIGVDTWQGYDSLVGLDDRYRLQQKLAICTDIPPPATEADLKSILERDIFRLAIDGKRGLLVSTEVPDVDSGHRLYEMWRRYFQQRER
jgi:uroporphyrinogen-III decarboxylase